jgi:predicted O-methyltransferase YrrM
VLFIRDVNGRLVAPSEIPFDHPAELRFAIKQNSAQLVAAAGQHNVPLTKDSVGTVAGVALAKGYVAGARVRIGDRTVIEVVDEENFVSGMDSFLCDIASGHASLPAEAPLQPSPAAPNSRVKRGLTKLARRMNADGIVPRRPEKIVKLAASGPFPAAQYPSEFGGVLRLVRKRTPRVLLEIGTNYGGTAFLLSRYAPRHAVLTTCDIECKVSPQQLEGIARRDQRIQFLQVDSHSDSGRQVIRSAVPDGVDFLFIDGDHSYEGVRQDFVNFADLLNPGGMLVFHDIVEDYGTRFGIATNAFVGGVPRFWGELQKALPSSFAFRELVEDRDQDGLGIGVVVCPDTPLPGRALIEAYLMAGHDVRND